MKEWRCFTVQRLIYNALLWRNAQFQKQSCTLVNLKYLLSTASVKKTNQAIIFASCSWYFRIQIGLYFSHKWNQDIVWGLRDGISQKQNGGIIISFLWSMQHLQWSVWWWYCWLFEHSILRVGLSDFPASFALYWKYFRQTKDIYKY